MKRLEGKHAVVTGAASGVGRATSLLFAREGAAVACVDIDAEMGEETAAMIRAEGGEALFVETDLTDPSSIDAMARACMDWRQVIHVLFNNAGVAERAEFEDIALEDWNRQIAVNLTAPFLCSQKLLPALKAAEGAAIIHHGSIDGVLGNPTLVAYSASKGGVQPLTHVMGFWLARHGIRVNCINSGALRESKQGIPVRLNRDNRAGAPMSDEQRRATPMGRPGFIEEAADVALYLASDESSYVNGSVITLDGGRTGLTPGTF
ncbi:MAG: SDR family oxidoreductase [Rickettsiales bacterium]|jgi:NAD(P)-dependent dehydrogenase (short-subunit alcohol dehydrogenase family)